MIGLRTVAKRLRLFDNEVSREAATTIDSYACMVEKGPDLYAVYIDGKLYLDSVFSDRGSAERVSYEVARYFPNSDVEVVALYQLAH